MVERDKIRELAEKLEPESDWSTGEIERILRADLESIQAEARQDAAIDKEINLHHSALIGKIQAVVDKAFPGERWADYDVLNQGVCRILERAEAAEKCLLQAQNAAIDLEKQLAEARAELAQSESRATAIIQRLQRELAEARAQALAPIKEALKTAGGRWCEWGGRAESVRDILEAAIERSAEKPPDVPAGVAQKGKP